MKGVYHKLIRISDIKMFDRVKKNIGSPLEIYDLRERIFNIRNNHVGLFSLKNEIKTRIK